MGNRRWTYEELENAVLSSRSIRQVLHKLSLREAGGNYKQIRKHIALRNIDISHFKGKGWNKGNFGAYQPRIALSEILTDNSDYQSYKLKKRLLREGLKRPKCELCGWAEISRDGRIPLELDHINGNNRDNRIENLRIICPNCHSLQETHRGMNRKR